MSCICRLRSLLYFAHVHVCKKTSQAIGIIYSHRAHLPDSCRALFYNAYILPHFDYCCTAWTNLSIAQQQKLETHNRSLLKILYHMPKSLSSVALYMVSSTRPLLERRRIMMCCLIHRIRLSKIPRILNHLTGSDGKTPLGTNSPFL